MTFLTPALIFTPARIPVPPGLQEGGCAALASALRACREAGCTTSLCAQYDSSEEWGGIPDLCPLL